MFFLLSIFMMVSSIHGSSSSNQPPSYDQAMAGSRIIRMVCTADTPYFSISNTAPDGQAPLPTQYIRIALAGTVHYVISDIDSQSLMDLSLHTIKTISEQLFNGFLQGLSPDTFIEDLGPLTLRKIWFLLLIQAGFLKSKSTITTQGPITLRTLSDLCKELSPALQTKLTADQTIQFSSIILKCNKCRISGKTTDAGDVDYVCTRGHHLCSTCITGPAGQRRCFCQEQSNPIQ